MILHRRPIAIACLATLVTGASAPGDTVEQRSGGRTIEGRIVAVEDVGITVRTDVGASHLIPWDRVRRVETVSPPTGLGAMMEIADDLWRARARLGRQDTELAEPLFTRHFDRYRGQTHETALVVSEGLLRCRLARGANADAVIPALETARLRRAGVTTDVYSILSPIVDEEMALCVDLPPAWVTDPALQRLVDDLEAYPVPDDPVIAVLARLYLQAARQQLGLRFDAGETAAAPRHAGIDFLEVLVRMGAADPDDRRSARDALKPRLEAMPAWSEAWARFCIGRSLLRESGTGRRQRGLVYLLHVPARFHEAQPFLAGLALDLAARALEGAGEPEAAGALRQDLNERYPHHPLLSARLRRPEDGRTRNDA